MEVFGVGYKTFAANRNLGKRARYNIVMTYKLIGLHKVSFNFNLITVSKGTVLLNATYILYINAQTLTFYSIKINTHYHFLTSDVYENTILKLLIVLRLIKKHKKNNSHLISYNWSSAWPKNISTRFNQTIKLSPLCYITEFWKRININLAPALK